MSRSRTFFRLREEKAAHVSPRKNRLLFQLLFGLYVLLIVYVTYILSGDVNSEFSFIEYKRSLPVSVQRAIERSRDMIYPHLRRDLQISYPKQEDSGEGS